MPPAIPEAMPGTLGTLSPYSPKVSTALPTQGTKRKANAMVDVESSKGTKQVYPLVKLERGSPAPSDFRGSNIREFRSGRCEVLAAFVDSSSSDDAEDQIANVYEDKDTTTGRPFSTQRIMSHSKNGESDGLLRPLPKVDKSSTPRRQKASDGEKRRLVSRKFSGKNQEDLDYNSIPDYSPPISTLPTGNSNVLKVKWCSKISTDLSNDPDRHKLHEAELQLATTLNLSCAKYLCTKRRIFQVRFKALKGGKEFRRVECQQASKINGNKASKLCGAWEKVGWFDRKHFSDYLRESNDTLENLNNEDKDKGSISSNDGKKEGCNPSIDSKDEGSKPTNGDDDKRSPSSGLCELDIWNVSDSVSSSEGDEESTDEDTADSSVSFDVRQDEAEGRKKLDSYPYTLLRKQTTRSSHEIIKESPVTEDRAPEKAATQETEYPGNSYSLSRGDSDDPMMLETRSMTKRFKLAQNSQLEDKSASFPSMNGKDSRQKSISEKPHPLATAINQVAKRNPIPHTLDDADAADTMLVKMRGKGCPWPEIEEAWAKQTGKAPVTKTLAHRYRRMMENFASTEAKACEEPGRFHALAYLPLALDDDQRLLAAETEVEENFRREKADLIAEIESNFTSEKWNLVAEAMSRSGSATYSAEVIQAQYEKLNREAGRAVTKDEDNKDTSPGSLRRTTRAVQGEPLEKSAPLRVDAVKVDQASNAITSPLDGTDRALQTVHKSKADFYANHSESMRRAWAKRRALGTDGHYGGPPRPSTIAMRAQLAAPNTVSTAETSVALVPTYKTEHASDSLPNQIQSSPFEPNVNRDVNPHKQSLAQIVPAATQANRRPKEKKPSKQHAPKRYTCKGCGGRYANQSEHYRIFPAIGSEHRRRMAANAAAAQSPLGPSTVGAGGGATDQMAFEVSSKE